MEYLSLNKYLKEKFGTKVYKLSLNGNMTCPNRDGTKGYKGCIFCSEGGSGEFACSGQSISEQLENAKKLVSNKIKSGKYIAYFQAFTNTYAPVDYLNDIFTQAIAPPEIAALSIATRPDCLGGDVLSLLDELNHKKPVFVELGLQTSCEASAEYIRRGYKNDCYIKAVRDLKRIGVNVVTHIILGLPFESREDMLRSVDFAAKCGTDGIKLQLLHVLKNTDLEKEYLEGKFQTLSPEEYIDILCDCIEILPKNTVIHRLTGDGDKKLLIAPLWSADKKRALNGINKAFTERSIIQGSKKIEDIL